MNYTDAGVNIAVADALIERIKPMASSTWRREVRTTVGGFGAMCAIPGKYKRPMLVSGTDGVGTKLLLAVELNRHHTIGQDLVAMCVNDILTQGAEPLFFLDYFACGKLDVELASRVIDGVAYGCTLAGCALVGGETAELPGLIDMPKYDIAGFAVGVVEEDKAITGRNIKSGDVLVGLASSGAHSNGYSLIRRVLSDSGVNLSQSWHLADLLMAPTRIYVRSILTLLQSVEVKGIAHITGGGLTGNVPRMLPEGCKAVIDYESWKMPTLFKWVQEAGCISDDEMHNVFNCGIGMVLALDKADVDKACSILGMAGEATHVIGVVECCR